MRREGADDRLAIRRVNELAFEGQVEADLVDALRAAGDVVLSMVSVDGATIVGHVLFSRLNIRTDDGRIVPALALAPMAVMPGRQREGIGSALLTEALDACRRLGERIVIVVGHTNFYPRFGFSHEKTTGLRSCYQCDAFMGLELEPAALRGVDGEVEYARAFAEV
jgi:putative acetyltransferase